MIPVWLVRHGEAAASWAEHPDPGLSALGWSQAETAAEQLLGEIPADVDLLSSPKARAQETAQPLAQHLGREVAIVDAFREIQAPVPLAERQQWLRGFMRQTWSDQPDAIWQWRQGILNALHILERPTVVFTHFLVINAVLAEVNKHEATVQAWPDNGSQHQFLCQNGAVKLVALGHQMDTIVT